MSVKRRNLAVLAAGLLLAACIAGGGAGREKASSANPITGGAIEVTALDAVPAAAAEPATTPPEKREVTPAAAPESKPALDSAKPPEKADSTAPETPTPEAAAAVPEALKTPAQLACEKKGNLWAKAGKSGASACVKRMKDGGKRCVNGTQCQGECLARSMTCSPYQPLFGCNEILQDNGVRMTLCID